MKIVRIGKKNLSIFWLTWKISIIFSGKDDLKEMIIKVTKKQRPDPLFKKCSFEIEPPLIWTLRNIAFKLFIVEGVSLHSKA